MAAKKVIRNIFILCLPFLLMMATNQLYEPKYKNTSYTKFGIATLNSSKKLNTKCTWICHNQTLYCKLKHVKYMRKYFAYTDSLYFGTIKSLNKTGSYEMANIIFLVLLIPLGIWFFIIQSLNISSKIKHLKKQNTL